MPNRLIDTLDFRARRLWRACRIRFVQPSLGYADVLAALRAIQLSPASVLMVHGSLSAFGYVRGGARTVIAALREWCGGRTLVMPTHSYCYPGLDGTSPVFEVARSPSLVGAISNAYWKQPGVTRSFHPTHSLACEGPGVDTLIAGHEDCDTSCGRGTPYERLIEQDAAVLMFGATMDSYTLFHTAEDAAEVPYLYEKHRVKLRLRARDGSEREMMMRKHDMTVSRSFSEKDSWLEERGLLRRLALGRGQLLLLPHSRQVHTALVEQLRVDPLFLTALRSLPK